MTIGPDNSIVRAEGAVELIVWLVIAVIWAIAQIVARARQKKDWAEPPPAPPPNQPQDLDEFFKLLRQQFEAGEARPATPPPIAKREVPVRPSRTKGLKDSRTIVSGVVSHRAPAQPSIKVPPAPVSEEPWADTIPKVTLESVRRDILSLKAGFSSRGLRMPDVRIASKFHRRTSPATRTLFHSRQGLKSAFVAKVVLGAPRSFRPWLYPED